MRVQWSFVAAVVSASLMIATGHDEGLITFAGWLWIAVGVLWIGLVVARWFVEEIPEEEDR
jgi:uncharacterized MAPEG superfamily protein